MCGAASNVAAQKPRFEMPRALGWSTWLWEQEGSCARGLRSFTADDLAAQLDSGETLAAVEAKLDQRVIREGRQIARCLTLFRDAKPRVARNYSKDGLVFDVDEQSIITDVRRAEINAALAKLDGDVSGIAAKAKAQLRKQSGAYFARNLYAPTHFTDAIAAYEFFIAKRRTLFQVCGPAPAAPPTTIGASLVRDTPYGAMFSAPTYILGSHCRLSRHLPPQLQK